MLSSACQIGIRAMLYQALRSGASYVPVHEISEKLDVSNHFLAKIIQQLTAKGLLRSHRGPHGGVTLARGADRIRLEEIDAFACTEGAAIFETRQSFASMFVSALTAGIFSPMHTKMTCAE